MKSFNLREKNKRHRRFLEIEKLIGSIFSRSLRHLRHFDYVFTILI
jgi:hypothetical protein